uniref:Oxidized purine nucleoside triphosphate hydrolase n=1 Tax=Cacopsylla melanoneura TaxID=428564 RepID=A0A8D8Q5L5_9HEMI
MSTTSRKVLTLVIIRKGSDILLGMKKRGFGAGKWNGFGGKVEPGETVLDGAKRELQEECHLTSDSLKEVGLLEFEFKNDPVLLETHVFTSDQFLGEPKETEEMRPQWFSIDNIPYHQMWLDDKYWLPLLIKGEQFKGYFLFEGQEKILNYDLKTL